MSVDISVIIPAYNAETTIGRCLDSVICQKPSIEIIVVDDCSTDATAQICQQYENTHDNIRLMRNSINVGQGLSRNKGIQAAQGKYIAFVDADDIISPYMYEDLLALSNKGAFDGVGCQLKVLQGFVVSRSGVEEVWRDIFFDNNFRCAKVRSFSKKEIDASIIPMLIGGYSSEPDQKAIPWSPCTYLYRTSLIKEHVIAFVSERTVYSEDLFFNLDFFTVANSCIITESEYYCYVNNPASTIHRFHDPVSKCKKLLEYTENNSDLLSRATIRIYDTYCGSVVRLALDKSIPWSMKIAEVNKLSGECLFKNSFADYPVNRLSMGGRLFRYLASHHHAKSQLVLSYAAYVKSIIPKGMKAVGHLIKMKLKRSFPEF